MTSKKYFPFFVFCIVLFITFVLTKQKTMKANLEYPWILEGIDESTGHNYSLVDTDIVENLGGRIAPEFEDESRCFEIPYKGKTFLTWVSCCGTFTREKQIS